MGPSRNFRLSRTRSVLVPLLEASVTRGVIAGEACTELGCEGSERGGRSWFARWLGLGEKAPRTLERNRKWNSAVNVL